MADATLVRRQIVEKKSLFGVRYEEVTLDSEGTVTARREVGGNSLSNQMARAKSKTAKSDNQDSSRASADKAKAKGKSAKSASVSKSAASSKSTKAASTVATPTRKSTSTASTVKKTAKKTAVN
jgi:hypothetical protein